MVLRSLLSRAAPKLDAAFNAMVLRRSPKTRRDPTGGMSAQQRIERLEHIQRVYGEEVHGPAFDSYFPALPTHLRGVHESAPRERAGGVLVSELTWPSTIAPIDPTIYARFPDLPSNRRAAARLLRKRGTGRPAVIVVHGYLGGHFGVEERIWPAQWFLDRGFDVALAVLPYHAVRAKNVNADPRRFFSGDPRWTIECFRQAITDLRNLVTILEERGARSVGVAGMSLGGYTSSLLATAEPRIAWLGALVPLASIPHSAQDDGSYVGDEAEQQAQFEGYSKVLSGVSPLARKPHVEGKRVVVLGATGDQITPIKHSQMLVDHFQGELAPFPGGHLLQVGRRESFSALERMFRREGVLG